MDKVRREMYIEAIKELQENHTAIDEGITIDWILRILMSLVVDSEPEESWTK